MWKLLQGQIMNGLGLVDELEIEKPSPLPEVACL